MYFIHRKNNHHIGPLPQKWAFPAQHSETPEGEWSLNVTVMGISPNANPPRKYGLMKGLFIIIVP